MAGVQNATSGSITDKLTRDHRMTLDEARLILNLKKEDPAESVLQVRSPETWSSNYSLTRPLVHSPALRTSLQSQLSSAGATKTCTRNTRDPATSVFTLCPIQGCAGAGANRRRIEGGRATPGIATSTSLASRRVIDTVRWQVQFMMTRHDYLEVLHCIIVCFIHPHSSESSNHMYIAIIMSTFGWRRVGAG